MSLSDPVARASLSARIQGILLRPSLEWDRIEVEPATVRGLFTGYAMILAAIGPVCSAIGLMVFGVGIPGIATWHANPVGAIVSALVSYLLALLGVFAVGLIIDALAPTFGGVKNQVQAMKVAVYGSTASWLAGVFGLIPMLGWLAILGLYSLYLYYVGLPKLMRTGKDKALGYTALVVVCAIVVFLVIGLVTAPLRYIGGGAPGFGNSGVTVVGDGGAVRVGAAGASLAALAAAGAQAQTVTTSTSTSAAGGTTTVTVANGGAAASPDALKTLLPASVAGYTRGDVSAEGTSLGGMNTSHARAEYAKGDARMTLEVSDTGGLAALGGLAASMGVNSTKETANGYEKVSTVGGRLVTEQYDRSDRSGKYAVMLGRGAVSAEGSGGATMDDLKAAAAAVDPARVSQLSHS